jgi:hypothetical protein
VELLILEKGGGQQHKRFPGILDRRQFRPVLVFALFRKSETMYPSTNMFDGM